MEYFAQSQKEFVYKYVVMLSDTDQFKHMSFANYLKLMFLATDALLVQCQHADFLNRYRLRLISSRMQFRKQTVVGDSTLIKVNSTAVDKSVFSLLHTFVIEGSGELVGLGKQCYELSDAKSKTAVDLSPVIRAALDPIEVDENNLLYKY